MTNEETINLLETLSQSIDKLASFNNKKGDKEKGDTIVNEDDKLSSTLSTTEKRRWQTMSTILAKTIKEVVFPEKEEKVGRPEFKNKQFQDTVISPTFSKIKEASNKWLSTILALLALLGGIIAGAIAEIGKMLKGLKAFLSETKLGKFIKDIFSALKTKFLEFIKVIRETKFVKFIEEFFKTKIIEPLSKFFKPVLNLFEDVKTVFKTKVIQPIRKFFETIGRLFRIFEGGKGPLFMMKAFPTFFKFFEDYIRIAAKVFQFGIKTGRLFGKLLGPIMAIFEVVIGLVQAFTDPKLSDKSFLQKIVTGLTQGLLNFFDFFEIFGLDLFKFETIRDRIEAIFKPFREGKWLEGLGQILNQLGSLIISIPGKIFGWVVGWFNKDLGAKITEFYDKFDLFKYFRAIFKRIGKIFGIVKSVFQSIADKVGPIVGPILKFLVKTSPFYIAFQMLKKAFEYALPIIKGLGSLVSKVFVSIKNFFITIWNWIKRIADKISGLPFMKKIGDELKAIASESQVDEMPTPTEAVAASVSSQNIDISGQENTASSDVEDVFSTQENNTQEAFSDFEDILSTQENNTQEAFSDFGKQMKNLNSTGAVNNKIAVDQLRETKTLNQKIDMLIEQLMNNRTMVNNFVNQTSMNSFPQSTSVSSVRQYHREAD